MNNRHLIARQVFELRAGIDQRDIHRLQDSFSRQYWQAVVPAFEQLFDRIVPADQLVRVERIEIDVGRWSAEQMLTGQFVANLVAQLEAAIAGALADGGEQAQVRSLAAGLFEQWLHFLEHGTLPVDALLPESYAHLQVQALAALGDQDSAVERLRALLSRHPQALQRLILQHDDKLLMRILERLSGRNLAGLAQLIEQVIDLIVQHNSALSEGVLAGAGPGDFGLQSITETLFELVAALLSGVVQGRTATELQHRIEHSLTVQASHPVALARALVGSGIWRQLLDQLVPDDERARVADEIAQLLRDQTGLGTVQADSADIGVADLLDLVRRDAVRAPRDARVTRQQTRPALRQLAFSIFDRVAALVYRAAQGRDDLPLRQAIVQAVTKAASTPSALASALLSGEFWHSVLAGLAHPDDVLRLSRHIPAFLQDSTDLRRIAAADVATASRLTPQMVRRIQRLVWQALFQPVLGAQRTTDAAGLMAAAIVSPVLSPWRALVRRGHVSREHAAQADASWQRLVREIDSLEPGALPQPAVNGQRSGEAVADTATSDAERETRPSQAGDCFYVQAAGVVLFHPFLPRFFENLGLYQDGGFVDEPSRQRAVCLLHHLATGESHTPEYSLVLEKLLCGMPFNLPLDHRFELDAAERSESENLIDTAIGHWSALGRCSAQWLREMFLLRDGKLERRETGWHLLVERKAQDLLLDKLPHGWGLGMVRLPWMDELLHIDW